MRLEEQAALGAEQGIVRRIVGAEGRVWIAERFDQLPAILTAHFHAGILPVRRAQEVGREFSRLMPAKVNSAEKYQSWFITAVIPVISL